MPWVEFAVESEEVCARFERLVDALCKAKSSGDFRDDASWLTFFDDAALAGFRPPHERPRRRFGLPGKRPRHEALRPSKGARGPSHGVRNGG